MEINYRDWITLIDEISDQKIISAKAIFVNGYADLLQESIHFVTEIYKKSGAKYVVLNGEKEFEIDAPGFVYLLPNQ